MPNKQTDPAMFHVLDWKKLREQLLDYLQSNPPTVEYGGKQWASIHLFKHELIRTVPMVAILPLRRTQERKLIRQRGEGKRRERTAQQKVDFTWNLLLWRMLTDSQTFGVETLKIKGKKKYMRVID